MFGCLDLVPDHGRMFDAASKTQHSCLLTACFDVTVAEYLLVMCLANGEKELPLYVEVEGTLKYKSAIVSVPPVLVQPQLVKLIAGEKCWKQRFFNWYKRLF